MSWGLNPDSNKIFHQHCLPCTYTGDIFLIQIASLVMHKGQRPIEVSRIRQSIFLKIKRAATENTFHPNSYPPTFNLCNVKYVLGFSSWLPSLFQMHKANIIITFLTHQSHLHIYYRVGWLLEATGMLGGCLYLGTTADP